jgi:hypothetical protein
MARQENNMIWSYPWIDGINSIILPSIKDGNLDIFLDINKSVDKIENSLKNEKKLYEMYFNGFYNARKYFYKNYIESYICYNILRKLNIGKQKKDEKNKEFIINQSSFRF